MSYDQIPGSPPHPSGDSQMPNLPPVNYYDKEELDFLDLNPDLENTPGPATMDAACSVDMVQNQQSMIPGIEDDEQQADSKNKLTEEGYLVRSERIPISDKSRVLTPTQQTRFHTYVTERLQSIQRRFIQSHGLNSEHSYKNLDELLIDLAQLIDIITVSLKTSQNFGQTNYLITIANDLLDYSEKYPLTFANAVELITVISNIDDIFSKVIDSGDFNGTECVRVNGIAERSRLALVYLFERGQIVGCEAALGKLYEKTLERTG
ncbi:hypothetical protein WICPIJ_007186 [Wickerhamomyces pijperi]|uniref:Uncharacterized protein n=1 Tax=Wickerhamomyces pijperi TaxID=599730 RepID=A0A9P8Q257_WICPI|nr:hypothetical protein WICPIJ_007186 [Wickerhamomyces pijperi]